MLKVNGKAYDWADVDVKFPGLVLQLQEISYDDEQEKEETYGKGSMPRGYGTGNYKASGKISMLRDDYDDLLDYANGDKVTHNEKKWVSDVDSNVWEPGVYGWSEYTEPVAAQEAAEDAGEATEG